MGGNDREGGSEQYIEKLIKKYFLKSNFNNNAPSLYQSIIFHRSEDKFNKAAKFPDERKYSDKNKVLVKLPCALNGPLTLLGPSIHF